MAEPEDDGTDQPEDDEGTYGWSLPETNGQQLQQSGSSPPAPSFNGQSRFGVYGVEGQPRQELTPQQVYALQERAQIDSMPTELRAQFMLAKLKLTQQEQMRMSKMQNAIGAIKARSDLTDADKADLLLQVQTGINPYQHRLAKAQLLEGKLQQQKLEQQNKMQAKFQIDQEEMLAGNYDKVVKVMQLPVEDENGQPVRDPATGKIKTRSVTMYPIAPGKFGPMDPKFFGQDDAGKKEKADQAREERVQKLVDTGEDKWRRAYEHHAKEVDAIIKKEREDAEIENKIAKEKGEGVRSVPHFNRELMIESRLRDEKYGGTLEEEVDRIRKMHGAPATTPTGKTQTPQPAVPSTSATPKLEKADPEAPAKARDYILNVANQEEMAKTPVAVPPEIDARLKKRFLNMDTGIRSKMNPPGSAKHDELAWKSSGLMYLLMSRYPDPKKMPPEQQVAYLHALEAVKPFLTEK